MKHITPLQQYRTHLENRYRMLIERSNDYQYEDESVSDTASFKAMKILEKINQLRFLERNLSDSLV